MPRDCLINLSLPKHQTCEQTKVSGHPGCQKSVDSKTIRVSPSRKSLYIHRFPARRQLLGCSVVRVRAILGRIWPQKAIQPWSNGGLNPHLSSWNGFLWPYPSQNGPKSDHRAPQKLSTKQSRSKKYAGADSEVEKAGCEAWGVDFDDF